MLYYIPQGVVPYRMTEVNSCALVGLGVLKIPEDFNISIDWKGTPDLYQNVVSWKSGKLTP